MSTTITMIAAAAENNALGKENDLVWHLPDDFKRFKKITSGHYIIMGRKTFESFPKPLPNRTHVIITRQKNYTAPNCIVVHDLKDAFSVVEGEDEAFVIGGGEIYSQALPYADKIELTRVHGTFEADAFFPEVDTDHWELLAEEHHPKDDRHDYAFTYLTYRKK